MKTVVSGLVLVLAVGLLVAELAMDVAPTERGELYLVFAAMALATFVVALMVWRTARRSAKLRTSLTVVALAAVAVTGAAVGVAAVTMFIEPHDLSLVLVAITLGVGLGGVVAGVVAKPLTSDLDAMSQTARRVAAGDLGARTGVVRCDELGEAARAMDQMVARLQTSEEERKQLLSAVGHDLRTPLGSMQAAIEALQDGVAPDPSAYLRGLALDVEHLSHLVDDLFLLARIDAGRFELTTVEVDLAELADEAVEAVTPVAARRRMQLKVNAPGHVGVVGDPAALGRVFRNLLANAVRYSPEAVVVEVVIERDEGFAEATVVDHGPGFSEEVRDRAFDPFFRADDSRSRESGGTGLGLAIARAIVEAHGGAIVVDDGPGGRVRFTVPLA